MVRTAWTLLPQQSQGCRGGVCKGCLPCRWGPAIAAMPIAAIAHGREDRQLLVYTAWMLLPQQSRGCGWQLQVVVRAQPVRRYRGALPGVSWQHRAGSWCYSQPGVCVGGGGTEVVSRYSATHES
jgi:hypothetical protein